MNTIYNSEQYSVVEFGADRDHEALRFGGYEIMDKSGQREIYIDGPAAELFRKDVQELIATEPSMEDIDTFLSQYDLMMHSPGNSLASTQGLPGFVLAAFAVHVFPSALNSAAISSSQTGIHTQLSSLLTKHAATPFRKPITDYNRRAFDSSIAAWHVAGAAPLILDT
eukprot:gene37595-45161_t